MRAKKQTAPIWNFLRTALATHEALKAGIVDATKCGPWIEECDVDENGQRIFLLNWNDFDPEFCDGVEGLVSSVERLIVDALTDDEFRRCVSGVFYREVLDDLDGKFHCGDSVDKSVIEAWDAAKKASSALDEQVAYQVKMMKIIQTDERIAELARLTRRCDRYIRLANKAYDAACESCCQFGWEKNVEKFIERDTPYPKVAVFADYIQGQPETLKTFYVRVDEEEFHFRTLEEAHACAFFHAESVFQSSSVDDYLEETIGRHSKAPRYGNG